MSVPRGGYTRGWEGRCTMRDGYIRGRGQMYRWVGGCTRGRGGCTREGRYTRGADPYSHQALWTDTHIMGNMGTSCGNRMTDIHDWKHCLPTTSFAGVKCFYWNLGSDGGADLDSLLDKLVTTINVDDETEIHAEKVEFTRFFFEIYTKLALLAFSYYLHLRIN